MSGAFRTHSGKSSRYSFSARSGGASSPEADGQGLNRKFTQLMICLTVLGLVLAIKAFFPHSAQELQSVFAQSMGSGLDYKTAFSNIGRTVSEGGDITAVWDAVKQELFAPQKSVPLTAQSETATSPPASAAPSSSLPLIAPASPSPSAIQDREDLPSPSSESLSRGGVRSDAQPAPSPTAQIISAWDTSLSYEEDEDDTDPIPFGYVLPDIVDYGVYPVSFPYRAPLQGTWTSYFGYRNHPIAGETKFHYGLDIAAGSGTPILAFADGVVDVVGESSVNGLYLKIQHDDGFLTFYAHCSKILVKKGQKVSLGDKIALVGQTGEATGPHLHFEVRRAGSVINPEQYLEEPS